MPINKQKLDSAITAAVARLRGSERGRQCLKDLKSMIDNGACSLDSGNGAALCVLVIAAIKEGKRDFIHDL